MPATNATSRFSDRVENYVRYRPGYPAEALQVLRDECGLEPAHVIADVASGTGIWTRMLLENGNRVFGVEPNAEMRQAGERLLGEYSRFTSVEGSAEATTLADRSVDFVMVAQAAHWFDRVRSRQEFARILRPGGWLALLWNERLTDTTPFLRDYEELLLRFGTDYEQVRHERTTDAVNEFFDPAPYRERVFPIRQEFDYAGLEGRLLSSSYAPGPGHPKHEAMLAELRRIYDAWAIAGHVGFEYKTRVYFGRLRGGQMSDHDAPQSFDDARQRFSAFLHDNGHPENVLWVGPNDLVWDNRRLWVRDHPSTLEYARQRYTNGIRSGLGINLHAFAITEGAIAAAVIVPTNDDAAHRHMMPAGGLKLSVLTNMRKARRVTNRVLWLFLSVLHKDSSRLTTSYLECS